METVLVVEDSRPMQRTLQRLFESDGLAVQIAADGLAGIESFRKQTPSVVVLDLKLPKMPGKEVCRAFKASAASVPIVILSANNDVEDKVLLLELGADDYVTKPFSPKELLARVRRAMRRSGQLPEAPGFAAPASQREVLAFDDIVIDFEENPLRDERINIDIAWQLWDGTTTAAQGSSVNKPWQDWGGTVERTLGRFKGKAGHRPRNGHECG